MDDGPDQLAISRILGSTFQPYSRGTFGGFSAVRSVGGMLAARPRREVRLTADPDRDAKIISTFEQIHQGYSLDRTLADPELVDRFLKRCRKLGVVAPPSAICRRLLRIRKEGDLTVATTNHDKRVLEPFLIPAELAFARLSYNHDASADDLLADPNLGASFDELARKFGRGKGEPVDYRLAALHLRKNVRARRGSDAGKLAKVHPSDVDRRWRKLGPLSRVPQDILPQTHGIFYLSEPNRHLYLTNHPNLRSGVAVFQDRRVLEAMSNRFWSPSPDNISVSVMTPDDVKGGDLRPYELKSLEMYRPIFNILPTAATAA